MGIGLIGTKVGMTRIFNEDGVSTPVTVVEVSVNRVTQIKNSAVDGYDAIQVTCGVKHAGRVSKPAAGHFAKASVEAGLGLWEFRLQDLAEAEGLELGSEVTVEKFADVKVVDVTGNTKGKGFQGGVKRHNFKMQDATHGNSLSHRAPGSIGQNQTPGRVFKGKKMAGQMGNVKQTTLNLELVKVDVENSLLLIKGALPGAKGSTVIVRKAIK
ncbi:MAG: 50S ribosomal protein L3 [Piscirickettsiaceae bacterium CG_4_9_14_3_um_filter_43_564]|nr:50S ribosomal protein L3 [Thiomicrospira sp.]OIP96189.1 MAG: 50S ribosomal protein L3 [Thiomicrospira sp. CG2_30_44_34]PIQ06130.1 MAG: 50S ribosomal protein L3 [Piscirickettsiaceae bacterium CG18_big_fil_WC_8_21_14_2_50_44_103]PIU38336.1 MAG: 50S ribosomal protein L3 [Piscirickettsiaceae bacterium CG07_land_8_20_14_0_80_44_28]PIW58238.1 MAG: 50S ribosomal protein L3 [Piscirickettsiaceae bacterium CG12_big_fil_rev_8_21_14_0_65_44_934]PIW76729.1 MAG: 50S ribosomal protein L3 [Piscirickettsiac